jgi:undecaprenyl-diphosphatase
MIKGDKNIRAQDVQLLHFSKKQMYLFFSVFLLTWGISFWLWQQTAIDRFVLLTFNNIHFGKEINNASLWFSQYGMSAICLVYFVYLNLCHKKTEWQDQRAVFLLIIVAFVLVTFSSELLKSLFGRPRPIHDFPGQIIDLSRAVSFSFPSGHSSESVALILPFLFFSEFRDFVHLGAKRVLILVAGGVCVSRLVLGAHYLSDVLAGIGWSFFCLPFAVWLSNAAMRQMRAADFEMASRRWLWVYGGLVVLLALT